MKEKKNLLIEQQALPAMKYYFIHHNNQLKPKMCYYFITVNPQVKLNLEKPAVMEEVE